MMISMAEDIHNQTIVYASSDNFFWKYFGKDFVNVLYYICLTILIFSLIVIFLRMIGFGCRGIQGGSPAAYYMSTHDIESGSCFSCLQSLATRWGLIFVIAAVISGVLLYGCLKLKEIFMDDGSTAGNSTPSTFYTSTEESWNGSSTETISNYTAGHSTSSTFYTSTEESWNGSSTEAIKNYTTVLFRILTHRMKFKN